jgi:hypothetical protein
MVRLTLYFTLVANVWMINGSLNQPILSTLLLAWLMHNEIETYTV